MEKVKGFFGAFIVGGLLGAMCQAFIIMYEAIIPNEAGFELAGSPFLFDQFVAAFSLVTCGFVMLILFLTNILPKVEKFGGFGATIPLFGLVGAVGGATLGVRGATGMSLGKSFRTGTWPIARFLIIGIVASFFIALAVGMLIQPDLSYVNNVPYVAPPGPDAPPTEAFLAVQAGLFAPVSILWAFLFAGCLSIIGQIFVYIIKPGVPGILNILLVGFIIGAIVTCFGVFPYLLNMGTGGITAPVVGAGEFTVTSVFFGTNLGMWTVTVVRIVVFCCVVACQFLWGFIGAAIKNGKAPAPEAAAGDAA